MKMKLNRVLLICLMLTCAYGFDNFFAWGLRSDGFTPAPRHSAVAAKPKTTSPAASAAKQLVSAEVSSQMESFFNVGSGFCWKNSYGRGVGKIPTDCGANEKDAGLCYPHCKPEFSGVGPMCWKPVKSHPRGVGTIPRSCPPGRHMEDGLCYNKCRDGYHGVAFLCWRGLKSHNRGVGKIPNVCSDGKELHQGLCYVKCPQGYTGVGPVCWTALEGYGRGVGKIPSCSADQVYDAGLCYKKCDDGYKGVGPVCWKVCGGSRPFDCGAACAANGAACAGAVVGMLQSVGEVVANVVTLGGAKGLITSAKSGIKASMKIAKTFKKNKIGKGEFVELFKKQAKKAGKEVDLETVSKIYDAVGDDLENEADESTSSVLKAKDALDLASNVDPTGITSVVTAFMFDKC